MTTNEIERIDVDTPDITADRLEALRDLIPEAFSEGKVDFEKLRAALGDVVDGRPERYSFTWAGKRDAIRLLQTPSAATLVPAPEESVNWDTTQHLFIEGDNLEVLKLLYKAYFGRVKLIYIDPPYNTGNDFVYPDDFADPLGRYLEITGQKDAAGNLLTSNPETSGRYHSAWLNMMYPRLFMARQLLRDDGAIFVTIDDSEEHNLRMLLNELFGEENFIESIVWQKKVSPSNDARFFSNDHDYIVVYAKSKELWRPIKLPRNEAQQAYYQNPDNDPRGPWNSATYTSNKSAKQRPNLNYPITNPNTGLEVWPRQEAVWKFSKDLHNKHVEEDRIYWGVDGQASMPRLKLFLEEMGDVVPRSVWLYADVGHTQEAMQEFRGFFTNVTFDTPKPSRLIKKIVQIGAPANDESIVLDFFSGSCSTAQAVMELNDADAGNRRYIMVQLPEPTGDNLYPTIAEIGKERIRKVINKVQQSTKQPSLLATSGEVSATGFRVFKLAPSALHAWQGTAAPTPDEYVNQLSLLSQPLRDGWRAEDVVWEVAIKEGFPLTSRVATAAAGGQEVYRVEDPDSGRVFHVCLDDTVSADVAAALGLASGDLLVVRDAAVDDTTAANLALQCRLKTL